MMYWYSNVHVVWMIVLLIAVIAAGAVGLRYALRGAGGGSHHETPEDTLKQRYARGEIERDEFESRLADLRK